MSTPDPFGSIIQNGQSFTPNDALRSAWRLAFELSPIILTSGIATKMGGALPIVAFTEGLNFVVSLLQGTANLQLDNFFAHFFPLAGASMIDQQVAMYPFANQSIAANATIQNPLHISLKMQCPAGNASGGYPLKLVTMMNLQNSLNQHNLAGGLYTILTPSFIYTNCVMSGMHDITGGDSTQSQVEWQLDFIQPLVTVSAAQTAYNGLIQKLTNGATISGTPTWSVFGLGVGNPTALVTSSLVPPSALQ